VDSAIATLAGTLGNSDINDMPLNGRNYQNLLARRLAVDRAPTTVGQMKRCGWSMAFSAPISTTTVPSRACRVRSPTAATILPVDAIQEFNLEENPKAEFGWRPGAVVNVGIKSGTNTVHGTAYAFGRSQDWAARNVFNPAPAEQLPTQLEQFGGVAGGAIIKDKLFYFAGYEGLRSFIGNPLGYSVPQLGPGLGAADPKNSMVDAIKALQAANIPISPVSLQLFGCTTTPVACNGGIIQGASATTTNYNVGFPNTNTSDNGVAKVDYNITDKHRINALAIIGNYLGNGADHPVVNGSFTNSLPLRTTTISGNWVYVPNSNVVNEFRVGYNKVDYSLVADDANLFADGKDYPLSTGVTSVGGFPTVTLSGFGAPLGSWRGRPQAFNTPVYDFQESVSYLRGYGAAVGGRGGGIGNDPSSRGFGCGCSTPDVAAGNPLVGSGASRVMRLGLKLFF